MLAKHLEPLPGAALRRGHRGVVHPGQRRRSIGIGNPPPVAVGVGVGVGGGGGGGGGGGVGGGDGGVHAEVLPKPAKPEAGAVAVGIPDHGERVPRQRDLAGQARRREQREAEGAMGAAGKHRHGRAGFMNGRAPGRHGGASSARLQQYVNNTART